MMTKKQIIDRIKETISIIPSGYIDEESANETLGRVEDMLNGILIDSGKNLA